MQPRQLVCNFAAILSVVLEDIFVSPVQFVPA
eukprot:COSAG01_NODE_15496_length_1331_cov_0.995130_1_plen_31_part_10